MRALTVGPLHLRFRLEITLADMMCIGMVTDHSSNDLFAIHIQLDQI